VTVELSKSYCLPGLLYATEANCYRYAYSLYKIFGVSSNENMLHMRHCLGLPSLMNMIENRRCKFMDRLLGDESFTVMCNVCNVLGF